jgi:3-oxoacyl-[acyl-carrier-protein] synthase II
MMETEETASARGAQPWFELLGFGTAHDAREIMGYCVRAEGATAAIEQALAETRIGPDDIGCIIAGANGSRTGDAMEANALRNVFGDRLANIPVTAPKAATGEMMGASGALCAVTAGLALQRQQVPPTAGFTCTDSGLQLSAQTQPFSGEYALVNAFSCDGNNAAMVIRLWKS